MCEIRSQGATSRFPRSSSLYDVDTAAVMGGYVHADVYVYNKDANNDDVPAVSTILRLTANDQL